MTFLTKNFILIKNNGVEENKTIMYSGEILKKLQYAMLERTDLINRLAEIHHSRTRELLNGSNALFDASTVFNNLKYSVLQTIDSAHDICISELAKSMGFTLPYLSLLISQLEEDDLVLRYQKDNNRRTNYVRLSANGTELMLKMKNSGDIAFHDLLRSSLTDKEIFDLTSIYDYILAVYEKKPRTPVDKKDADTFVLCKRLKNQINTESRLLNTCLILPVFTGKTANKTRQNIADNEVLSIVDENGPIKMQDVAEKIDAPPYQIGRITERLVKSNLVQRSKLPADRKVVILQMTESGRGFIKKNNELMQILVGELVEPLSEAELEKLYRYIVVASKTMRKVIDSTAVVTEYSEFSA